MSSKFPHVTFLLAKEYPGEEGIWNPRDDDPPVEGGFQVNVLGTREHYFKLAEAIRRFAEQDRSNDADYHEHFEEVMSANGKVRLHLILRKDDVGDSTWKDWFPNE